MNFVTIAIWVFGVGLEAGLIARGLVTRITKEFPLFFSYIAFILTCEIICFFVYNLSPANYASYYWFYFVARMLMEFAVLFGVSDSVFRPYPSVRNLGRVIVGMACLGFVLWYWLPLQENPQPTPVMFLSLIKVSAITKGIAIALLFAFAKSYRISLGRNAGGILLGFAGYLGVLVAVFAAAIHYGRAIYAPVLSWLGPVSFGVCLSIWTISLWNRDPVTRLQTAAGTEPEAGAYRPEFQLRRFSAFVTRFLSK